MMYSVTPWRSLADAMLERSKLLADPFVHFSNSINFQIEFVFPLDVLALNWNFLDRLQLKMLEKAKNASFSVRVIKIDWSYIRKIIAAPAIWQNSIRSNQSLFCGQQFW